jgi:hypothetical protein
LLINQHVREPFRFSENQLDRMKSSLEHRARLLCDLLPWDDANEGIDERWVQCLPYGQTVRPGEGARVAVRVMNHSDQPRSFRLRPQAPSGWASTPEARTVIVPARAESDVVFSLQPDAEARAGVHVVTLDVAVGEWDLRRWCEAIVEIDAADQEE